MNKPQIASFRLSLQDGQRLLKRVQQEINQIIVGQAQPVRLALCCLLARGHLLIEDIPGVGKTTLARVLAQVLGLPFSRIQFTSDLLPADIIGVSTFDPEAHQFVFHPGPIFASIILADEVNRATPKAQSALLEAMEENQISAEGETRALPKPFLVIATQNPHEQIGTFPLPESQLDRFLMRLSLGYPDPKAEKLLLKGTDRRDMLPSLSAVLDANDILDLQTQCRRIHCSDALVEYVHALLDETRRNDRFQYGLSPRAGLALTHAARAWAFLEGRDMVLPEDVQAVAPSVLNHRLQGSDPGIMNLASNSVQQLLQSVPIP